MTIFRWKSLRGRKATDTRMSRKRFVKKALIAIVALVGAGAVLHALWQQGVFLPGWITWENATFNDAAGEYEVMLSHKKATVRQNESVIWTSPADMRVQQALSGDIDNDGEDELILLCWKVGRYGRSKPFWVKEDERKWSQHISVYEYGQEKIKPKWMSSYIGQDVTWMAVGSRGAGSLKGQNEAESDEELPNRESQRKRLLLTAPDGKVSSWFWDSWGFTKEETEVSFVVFGDNLIHEPIYRYGLNRDGDFSFLYGNMKEKILESDIAVINQETPLVERPAMYSDYPRFGTPAQVGEAIAVSGFDVVTCATNHALDQGVYGINHTKKLFEAHDIICIGIQSEDEKEYEPYDIIVRNGIRFAMLNYTYGTNGMKLPEEYPYMVHLLDDVDRVRSDIERAEAESDLVIVFAHWGTEYAKQPDEFQQEWAEVFLESGVDVVVGTHPHVLQPFEVLRGDDGHEMLIYYSIGNYISAQSEKTCVKGGMAEFTASLTSDGYKITEYALEPLRITWQEGGKWTVDFQK